MARFPERQLSDVVPGHAERECAAGVCDGSGWIEDADTRTARPCPCRAQLLAKRRARTLSQRIPSKYEHVGWDRNPVPQIEAINPQVTRQVRAFCRRIDEHLDRGEGLWLWGNKGTGKTTLAYLVTKCAIEAGRSVAVYTAPALLNALRDTYREDSPVSTMQLIEQLSDVDLLHVEDLAVARPTEWVLEQLYTIVNNRYDERRSIVFTSDAQTADRDEDPSPMRLATAVGERTLSRLIEMCGYPKVMLGEDQRLLVGLHRDATDGISVHQ